MSDKQTYKEQKAAIHDEQHSLSREEVADLMRKRSEYQADLDNMPHIEHRWIDRGKVMSCEGATHPNHRAFKRT